MKEIKAIIQPFMFDKVIDALREHGGLPGVTVSEVIGWGKFPAENAAEEVSEGSSPFTNKTKLEIVVADELLESIVNIIARAAQTGRPGDGKIFISNVLEAVKIRTGERGNDAI
jgi:nitrogen regulatory protein P-II 1